MPRLLFPTMAEVETREALHGMRALPILSIVFGIEDGVGVVVRVASRIEALPMAQIDLSEGRRGYTTVENLLCVRTAR